MFEPNSIRSLLKKRNMCKLSAQNQIGKNQKDKMSKTCSDFSSISKNNTDPDLQTVLQAKLMIKQIDNQVYNIRAWRQNQRVILEERLKNNSELYNESGQQYRKYADQRIEQEILNNKKMIQKLKIEQNKLKRNNMGSNGSMLIDNGNSETLDSSEAGELNYEDWEGHLYDAELMANITNGEDKINLLKHMKAQIGQNMEDKHIAFINSIAQLSMSDIFNKKGKQQNSNVSNVNSEKFNHQKLKQQLDDIDKQLKQMEDLMKD